MSLARTKESAPRQEPPLAIGGERQRRRAGSRAVALHRSARCRGLELLQRRWVRSHVRGVCTPLTQNVMRNLARRCLGHLLRQTSQLALHARGHNGRGGGVRMRQCVLGCIHVAYKARGDGLTRNQVTANAQRGHGQRAGLPRRQQREGGRGRGAVASGGWAVCDLELLGSVRSCSRGYFTRDLLRRLRSNLRVYQDPFLRLFGVYFSGLCSACVTPSHIHTCIHAYVQTCIHTYIHTYMHAYVYTNTHTHIHTHTHMYIM